MLLTNFGILASFLIYMIFWIQIPGMLFTSALLPKKLRWSTKLSAGFFLGFTVLAILYYFETLLKVKYVIAIAGPVFSVIAIALYLKKQRPSLLDDYEEIRPTFYVIFGIILIMCLLGYVFPYIKATKGITTQVFHDMLFHVGNITSLSRSFPNDDIRVVGITFYYHYFMELLFAMCKHIFGMSTYELYLLGDAPMSAWVLTPALITIGETIKGNKAVTERRYFLYCFSTFLACVGVMPLTVRWGSYPISWNNNHMFCNGNAIGIAVASTIIVLDIVLVIWESEFNPKYVFAFFLLMIASTGFKGTTGLLLAGIVLSVFIIEWIITKRFSIQKMLYALSGLIAFGLTYITVVAGWHTNGSNNRTTTFGTIGTLELSQISNMFIEKNILSAYKPLHAAFMLVLDVIFITGPLFFLVVPFSVYKLKEIVRTKEIIDIYDWFCIGSIIIAWFGFCFFSIEGMSQGYLVLSVTPLIVYLSIKYVRLKQSVFVEDFFVVVMGIGALLVLFDAGFYTFDSVKQNEVYSKSDAGRAELVSFHYMDAYYWLKDNTPEDSLVAVDIHTEKLDFRYIYFYCSSFSERQCYIEGYDYTDVNESISDEMMEINSRFYGSDKAEVEGLLEEHGIDYLVVSDRENKDYQPPTDRLTLVYQNAKARIYQFN